MRKLLFQGEFFEQVAGSAFFEADYERQVLAQKDVLFAGWHATDFKCQVSARGNARGAKKPDMALVHREFREWWVVEVELASHDFHNHVLDQVDVFALGEYQGEHVSYLQERLPGIDHARLRTLVTTVQPGVLVIVNEDVEGWSAILSTRGAKYCVVQPHRDMHGHYGYLVSGFLPPASSSFLSACKRAKWAPRAIHVLNPAAVDLVHGQHVPVRTEKGTGTWKHLTIADGAFLMPVGPGDPLPSAEQEFELHRGDDGQFLIEVRRRSSSRRGA